MVWDWRYGGKYIAAREGYWLRFSSKRTVLWVSQCKWNWAIFSSMFWFFLDFFSSLNFYLFRRSLATHATQTAYFKLCISASHSETKYWSIKWRTNQEQKNLCWPVLQTCKFPEICRSSQKSITKFYFSGFIPLRRKKRKWGRLHRRSLSPACVRRRKSSTITCSKMLTNSSTFLSITSMKSFSPSETKAK